MIRYLPVLLAVGLMLYALIDCGTSPTSRVKFLPKAVWMLLIILIPYGGPLTWILAGRAPRGGQQWPVRPEPSEPPRGPSPDDDPAFLAKIDKLAKESAANAEFLKKWEEDLKRREQEFKQPPDGEGREVPPSAATDGPPPA